MVTRTANSIFEPIHTPPERSRLGLELPEVVSFRFTQIRNSIGLFWDCHDIKQILGFQFQHNILYHRPYIILTGSQLSTMTPSSDRVTVYNIVFIVNKKSDLRESLL